MNIILFGPPGAGKGTQAEKIVTAFDLHKVSTGDLLRKEVKDETEIGKEIKSLMDKGSFVSDDTMNDLIRKILSNNIYHNRIIFDGYPRNLNQAKSFNILLKKYDQKISLVLSLDVDKETLVKRVLGRRTCTKCGFTFNKYFNPATNKDHTCDSRFLKKRTDDNEKTILNRYESYLEKTLPMLNFYKDLNLFHQINGKGKIDEIFDEIRGIITTLEA